MEPVTQAEVERRLGDARLRLAEATGGAALCRVGPDAGAGRLAVKRAEGEAVALGDLRDAMRGQVDPIAALRDVTARWQADLAFHRDRGTSAEWMAYCEGGVVALAELATSTGP